MILSVIFHCGQLHNIAKQSHTQPFYGSTDFVRDNPGEPVPKETFTQNLQLVVIKENNSLALIGSCVGCCK